MDTPELCFALFGATALACSGGRVILGNCFWLSELNREAWFALARLASGTWSGFGSEAGADAEVSSKPSALVGTGF